jgi:phosphate transport system substrate-binding protein
MRNEGKILWCVAVSAMLFGGCFKERKETPTKGYTSILVGESVAPVMQQEKEKFEELYREASIHLSVMPSREALVKFFNEETTKVVVVSRSLNDEERMIAKRDKLVFQEHKIAVDAVAIIVNTENPVTKLRTTELDSILRGFITTWKPFGWRKSNAAIEICLPNQNSSTFEVVQTKVLHGHPFGTIAKMVNSSTEMIQYVTTHSNALGMVGLVWLSQYRDTVKVLELSDPSAPDSLRIAGQYFAPFQAHVYRRYYPLTREVYIYSKADNYSVAAGFITFVASAPGQKIILNSGMVPATMPIRLVEITKKELTQ